MWFTIIKVIFSGRNICFVLNLKYLACSHMCSSVLNHLAYTVRGHRISCLNKLKWAQICVWGVGLFIHLACWMRSKTWLPLDHLYFSLFTSVRSTGSPWWPDFEEAGEMNNRVLRKLVTHGAVRMTPLFFFSQTDSYNPANNVWGLMPEYESYCPQNSENLS